jgi:hypothetical protein
MALPLLTSLALASSQDSVGVSSLATGSVSPPSDCLLVVAGCQDSGAGTGITMSTTLANVGAWTVVTTADYATSDKTWIAYAKVTGAPGSGTVTASFSTNLVDAVVFRLFYITGHNTTTPVPQSKTNTGTAATATVTLTSTPAATSQVFAVTGQIHGTTAGSQAMVPSGTEINQDYLNNTSFNFDIEAEMQYVNGSAGTTHTVGTLGAPAAWGIVAIEIAASPPNVTQSRDRDRRAVRETGSRGRWATRDHGRQQRSQFELYHAATLVGGPVSLTSNITDAAGGTDALTQTAVVLARSITETANGTDAVARTLAQPRAITDAASGTDAITRSRVSSRSVSDAAGGSDAVARSLVEARSITDAGAGTDAVTRAGAITRAVSDTGSGTDAVFRALVLARSVSDSAPASDSASTGAAVRPITDTAGGTDSVTRALLDTRSITDAAAGTDAVARAVVLARSISDTAAGTDAVTRVSVRTRAVTDSAGGSDAVARLVVLPRAITDVGAGSDAVTRIGVRSRAITDTAAGTDAVARAN